MFSDLFDPLIQSRYNHLSGSRQYHDTDVNKLRFPFESNTDSTFDVNKYILSSRLRITRNLAGYTFPTFCTRAERRRVEAKFSQAFKRLSEKNSKFNGSYHRLSTIDEHAQEKLVSVSAST